MGRRAYTAPDIGGGGAVQGGLHVNFYLRCWCKVCFNICNIYPTII